MEDILGVRPVGLRLTFELWRSAQQELVERRNPTIIYKECSKRTRKVYRRTKNSKQLICDYEKMFIDECEDGPSEDYWIQIFRRWKKN